MKTGPRKPGFVFSGITLIALWVLIGFAHWPLAKLPDGTQVDRVVVLKKQSVMLLQSQGIELKRYKVAFGGNPLGHKQCQGDQRTPEGAYTLDWRNPKSAFCLSLHISYPNAADVRRAKQAGVDPGGQIMIHGIKNGLGWIGRFHRLLNWTDGCVAVTNAEIKEIWRVVPNGTPIEIYP